MTNTRIHGKYLFRLALAFVGMTSCNVLSAQCPASFTEAPGSPIPVGVNPADFGLGDFNGDGKLDLAVPNNGIPFTVSILLGNGNGTFTEALGSPFAVGTNPSHAAVGDFNGDGKLDLAVTDGTDRNIWILLGNGAGQFTLAGSPIPAGYSTTLAVGDFNGDGKLDIAAESYDTNDVFILLGNGNGTFTEALGSPIAVGTTPASVTMGDFNGDGKLDLAVGNLLSDNISILLGDGAGGFKEALGSPIPVGSVPEGIAVADFNGDHKLDFAVANANSNTVSIMLGDGTGGFVSALGSPIGVGSEPAWVAVADFNGDNKLDFAVTNASSNTVSILLGDGTGAFTLSGPPIAVGSRPAYSAIGDFNGDSKPDLALVNFFSNNVSILLNTSVCLRTPQQATESLIDSINILINQGVLNRGRGNSLVQKLEAALQQMDRGNSNPAKNQLGAFINEVNALMNSRALSASQGQSLIDAASAIISQLSG